MNKNAEPFKPGDTAIRHVRLGRWNSREDWCVVDRVTPAGTVFVRSLDPSALLTEHRKGVDLRRPSKHESERRDWWASKPKDLKYIYIAEPFGWTRQYEVDRVTLRELGSSYGDAPDRIMTFDACMKVADEFKRVAEWLYKEPNAQQADDEE